MLFDQNQTKSTKIVFLNVVHKDSCHHHNVTYIYIYTYAHIYIYIYIYHTIFLQLQCLNIFTVVSFSTYIYIYRVIYTCVANIAKTHETTAIWIVESSAGKHRVVWFGCLVCWATHPFFLTLLPLGLVLPAWFVGCLVGGMVSLDGWMDGWMDGCAVNTGARVGEGATHVPDFQVSSWSLE